MEHTGLGIHIAFSKYPLGNEKNYIDNISTLYKKYNNDIIERIKYSGNINDSDYFNSLYKPAIYHLYSHFDVAFISLIDNFKFPQRVFEPLKNDENSKSVSYQILSGSVFKTEKSPDPEFLVIDNPEFIKIIQLKINNGLLIGNGARLFEEIIKLIEIELIKIGIEKYIFVNSYNWGEITIICLHPLPNALAKFLLFIRLLTIDSISNSEIRNFIIRDSLYNRWGESGIEKSHLFSDTFSYFGVNFNEIQNVDSNVPFYSEIEWQIKPGHFPFFAESMKDSPLNFDDNLKSVFFKNGKTDYLVLEKNQDLFISNKKLFEILRQKGPTHPVLSHIRKVKTKPLFKLDDDIVKITSSMRAIITDGPKNTEINLFKYKIINCDEITELLKKLNISRNTRKKINKIIYNYNLGIQDPILYIYFIDLYGLIKLFIRDLKQLAEETEKSFVNGVISLELSNITKELSYGNVPPLKTIVIQEKLIDVYINVFQEAIEDRFLNNYNYEDINEFSLDVNSSLTNLVSSLDTIIKFYGSCFRGEDGISIVTTINENETKSNKLSVNYNIEHITNVPLIFSTLIKEILNVSILQDKYQIKNNKSFEKLNNEFLEKIKDNSDRKLLYNFLDLINFVYFEIDYKKYHLTYLRDTDLYIFWHWTYALQCTHLYNSIGYFDENYFIRELFRLVIIIKVVDQTKVKKLKCPIPELRTYWDKYFGRILHIVDIISDTEAFSEICETLNMQVSNSLNNLNYKSTNGINGDNSSSFNIEDHMRVICGCATENTALNISEFYDRIMIDVNSMHNEINNGSNAKYYRVLSFISFYSLKFIQNKFNSKHSILRRNYLDGTPLKHFLSNDIKWYIDPVGGFFINDIVERRENMLLNNKMLYLLWHLGTVRKRDSFVLSK